MAGSAGKKAGQVLLKDGDPVNTKLLDSSSLVVPASFVGGMDFEEDELLRPSSSP